MQVAIVLPELGAGEDVVRVGCWLVEPGEAVMAGDRLMELVLPGMTFDLSAPVSGVMGRVDKPLDSTVKPGDVLGWIHEHGTGDAGFGPGEPGDDVTE